MVLFYYQPLKPSIFIITQSFLTKHIFVWLNGMYSQIQDMALAEHFLRISLLQYKSIPKFPKKTLTYT
jgi:hypothetical protein